MDPLMDSFDEQLGGRQSVFDGAAQAEYRAVMASVGGWRRENKLLTPPLPPVPVGGRRREKELLPPSFPPAPPGELGQSEGYGNDNSHEAHLSEVDIATDSKFDKRKSNRKGGSKNRKQ